tara:strand:+ start:3769 stop:7047 length:3279 start_codon:yes stop_codon:yes gene_type:complete
MALSDYKLQAWLLSNAEELIHQCDRLARDMDEVAQSGYYSPALPENPVDGQMGMQYIKKVMHRENHFPQADKPEELLPANALDVSESVDFITDVPPVIRRALKPQAILYKSFVFTYEQQGYEADLPLTTVAITEKEMKEMVSLPQIDTIEINRLGGNEAEIDSNITVNIRLWAAKIGHFFKKQKNFQLLRIPKQLGPNGKQLVMTDIPEDVRRKINKGISWIDLIKFGAEDGGQMVDPYGRLLSAAGIDSGIDPKEQINSNTFGYDTEEHRIKLELSYPASIIDTLVERGKLRASTQEIDKYKRQLEAQREVYYLNLTQNALTFNAVDASVEMQIDYVASAATADVSRQADLLFDPYMYERELRINDDICKIQNNMNDEEVVNIELDPISPKSSEKTRTVTTQDEKNQAVSDLQSMKKRLYVIQANKLINGLYGSALTLHSSGDRLHAPGQSSLVSWDMTGDEDAIGTRQKYYSRAWFAVIPEAWVKNTVQKCRGQVGQRGWALYNMGLSYVRKGGGHESGSRIYEAQKLIEKMVSSAHGTNSHDYEHEVNEGSFDVIGETDESNVEFVFFGDILETALEVLAANNRLGEYDFGHMMPSDIEDAAGPGLPALGGSELERIIDNPSQHIVEVPGDVQASGKPTKTAYNTEQFIRPFYWDRDMTKLSGVAGSESATFTWNPNLSPQSGYATRREIDLYNMVGELLMTSIEYPDPANPNEEIALSLADLPISMIEFKKWFKANVSGVQKKHFFLKNYIESLLKWVSRLVKEAVSDQQSKTDDVEPPPLLLNRYFVNNDSSRFLYNAFPNFDDALSGNNYDTLSKIIMYQNAIEIPNLQTFIKEHCALNVAGGQLFAKGISVMGQSINIDISKQKAGIYEHDRKLGIAHISYSDPMEGLLDDMSFQREDMKGLREARLFEGRDMYALNILREKYNSTLRFVGNTFFKPGMYVYIDPNPLDLGRTSDSVSPSRALGLGGYHMVTRLNHLLSLSGNNTWETTVETQWQTFGDDSGVPKRTDGEKCQSSIRRRIRAYRNAFWTASSETQNKSILNNPNAAQKRQLQAISDVELSNLRSSMSDTEWRKIEQYLKKFDLID